MTRSSEEVHKYLSVREKLLSELKRSGEFCISPDFSAAQELHLNPGQVRELPVDTKEVDMDLIRYGIMHYAVRSRGAQTGFNFRINGPAFNSNNQLLLTVESLGYRTIEIFNGDKIGRFYHERGAQMLYGRELEEFCHLYIHNKDKNSKKDDWFLVRSNNQPTISSSQRNYAVGIGLFLDESINLYVTPGLPIAIFNDSIKDYRGLLDREVLKQITNSIKEPGLHISQTRATVMLPIGINGILEYGLGNIYGAQIESHLIEGGKTNWPLRVEYIKESVIGIHNGKPYVVIHLYKNHT